MSDTQHQPVGYDMSSFWRLVSVEGGPVTGTFAVSHLGRGRYRVTAVNVTVWADDERTLRPHVRAMTAFIEGDNVRLGYIDPDVRDDVLARSDDVKAAVLAAARAVEWGDHA